MSEKIPEPPPVPTVETPITQRGLEHVNLWMAVISAILSLFSVLLLLGIGLPRQEKYINDFGEASREIKATREDMREFIRINEKYQRALQRFEVILGNAEKKARGKK